MVAAGEEVSTLQVGVVCDVERFCAEYDFRLQLIEVFLKLNAL